ncbi:MAG: transglycosylase SLT domain-containing protein [Nitrospirota bacterium]|nr:MAG: transglycosylase SLT domain-containing protein [Nitrospirota bacterium]
MKTFVFVALLLGVLTVLWELPKWEQKAVARQVIPKQVTVDLPTFDTQIFLRHVKTRFPRYKEEFQRSAEAQGIPWTLLAAQAYQESRWNRNAMSPTGVRGLMMLTRATASDLGVKNRLDPKKSIAGGAQYFAHLYRRIPQQVSEPDRTFLALAAYNVGLGHVKDARILASRLKKDPNKWDDLKTVLPLLSKKKYYRTLPHRYARGWEPVHYVKRIRAYRILLEQLLQQNGQQNSEL